VAKATTGLDLQALLANFLQGYSAPATDTAAKVS
jgi:hypothetical protein